MSNNKEFQTELRQKAEKKSLQIPSLSTDELKSMPLEDISVQIHELYVHKIELEMQNEELYKTQLELYNAKMRYFELYDMAPVGYCTLSAKGLILEANLTCTEMLGVSRALLQNQAFNNFVYKEDQDIYYLFNKKVDASQEHESCELRMHNSEGKNFWVQLVATSEKDVRGDYTQKVILSNITERKTIEDMKKYSEKLQKHSEHILLAREDERKSIAREVHDELGQLMTAIKIDLAWLKKKLPKSAEDLVPKIDVMMGLIDSGIKSIRDIVSKLRPPILDDLGLEAAMEWHAEKYLTSANIAYEILFKLEPDLLSEELSTLFFRIYQEALTNSIRHSGAKKISISLAHENDSIILQIKDNGIGITDKQINSAKSFGLIGIKERLRPYSGTFEISSNPGSGTTLKVSIHNFKRETYND